MTWAVTVAAIIERQGRFLMVEETDGVNPQRVLNQPAGHVDPGEAVLTAVVRETWEETGLTFEPRHLIGLYHVQAKNGRNYLRVCFCGTVPEGVQAAPHDPDILGCHWLTRQEIAQRGPRSSAVLHCIDDYMAGRRLPLEAVGAFHCDR